MSENTGRKLKLLHATLPARLKTWICETSQAACVDEFFPYELYACADECEKYDSAIIALDSIFLQTPNEIFAWYMFATTRLKPGPSMDV